MKIIQKTALLMSVALLLGGSTVFAGKKNKKTTGPKKLNTQQASASSTPTKKLTGSEIEELKKIADILIVYKKLTNHLRQFIPLRLNLSKLDEKYEITRYRWKTEVIETLSHNQQYPTELVAALLQQDPRGIEIALDDCACALNKDDLSKMKKIIKNFKISNIPAIKLFSEMKSAHIDTLEQSYKDNTNLLKNLFEELEATLFLNEETIEKKPLACPIDKEIEKKYEIIKKNLAFLTNIFIKKSTPEYQILSHLILTNKDMQEAEPVEHLPPQQDKNIMLKFIEVSYNTAQSALSECYESMLSEQEINELCIHVYNLILSDRGPRSPHLNQLPEYIKELMLGDCPTDTFLFEQLPCIAAAAAPSKKKKGKQTTFLEYRDTGEPIVFDTPQKSDEPILHAVRVAQNKVVAVVADHEKQAVTDLNKSCAEIIRAAVNSSPTSDSEETPSYDFTETHPQLETFDGSQITEENEYYIKISTAYADYIFYKPTKEPVVLTPLGTTYHKRTDEYLNASVLDAGKAVKTTGYSYEKLIPMAADWLVNSIGRDHIHKDESGREVPIKIIAGKIVPRASSGDEEIDCIFSWGFLPHDNRICYHRCGTRREDCMQLMQEYISQKYELDFPGLPGAGT